MSVFESREDPVCILSFGALLDYKLGCPLTACSNNADNGGPGTYSQLLIVKEYMIRIAEDLGVSEEDVYPADHFDLMGGVGFGGYVHQSSIVPFLIKAARLVSIMLGHLRMSINEATDALLTIATTIFPSSPDEEPDLGLNTKNLTEAVENMLQTVDVPLDTKMNDSRRPTGKCKV